MKRERIYQITIGVLVGILITLIILNYDISIDKKDKRDKGNVVLETKKDLSIPFNDIPMMTTEELNAKLKDPDVIVLDVRDNEHWISATEKIKGAVRENPTSVESWYSKYSKDKEKTIVTY